MNPGLLRHTITIQDRSSSTRSAIGEEVLTWTTFATLRARIEPLRGNEAIALQMQASEITTKIRTRYVAGVKAQMRVVHGADVYNISEVYSPFAMNRELEMLCSRDAD